LAAAKLATQYLTHPEHFHVPAARSRVPTACHFAGQPAEHGQRKRIAYASGRLKAEGAARERTMLWRGDLQPAGRPTNIAGAKLDWQAF